MNASSGRFSQSRLFGVYLVWLVALFAVFTRPELSRWGVAGFALLLWIWLPFWAWRNWTLVAADPPATAATVCVTLLHLSLLGGYLQTGGAGLGSLLEALGFERPFKPQAEYRLFFVLTVLAVHATPTLWRLLKAGWARLLPRR